jgi:hypothetical protein
MEPSGRDCSGDAAQAADFAEELIAVAPVRESGYRRLMDADRDTRVEFAQRVA